MKGLCPFHDLGELLIGQSELKSEINWPLHRNKRPTGQKQRWNRNIWLMCFYSSLPHSQQTSLINHDSFSSSKVWGVLIRTTSWLDLVRILLLFQTSAAFWMILPVQTAFSPLCSFLSHIYKSGLVLQLCRNYWQYIQALIQPQIKLHWGGWLPSVVTERWGFVFWCVSS